jgi:acetyltransferase-like isoleucine patch superfamily enzyme
LKRPLHQLSWDWYPGTIPENTKIDETAYIETTFSFRFFRSRLPVGVEYGRGASTYLGTMFDVGPNGRVTLGDYALVHGARIICDIEVAIGDHALISWNVVLMDTYRLPDDAVQRRRELELIPHREIRVAGDGRDGTPLASAQPIHIGPNVWIGFESCVLPGVTIGEGSIIGARSVVTTNVPPFTIVAGNPARIVRALTAEEKKSHAA